MIPQSVLNAYCHERFQLKVGQDQEIIQWLTTLQIAQQIFSHAKYLSIILYVEYHMTLD